MSKLINEILNAYSMLELSGEGDIENKKRYLDEVKDYALSGTYTNTKHKEYLLRNYLRPITEQMSDLGLSQPAIYKNRKLINRDLEKRLGKNIVKNILLGNFDEVEQVLSYSISEQPLGMVIIQNVVDTIRARKKESRQQDSTFNLEDCLDEIKLLKKYSVLDLELSLDKVDVCKLNYLLKLISFEESNVKDRGKLIEVIKR